jgi:hypothetical protein
MKYVFIVSVVLLLISSYWVYVHDLHALAADIILSLAYNGSFVDAYTLVWLGTEEGIASKYEGIERMHGLALSLNKTLVIVNGNCGHYRSLKENPKGHYSLCHVFSFPKTITCLDAPVGVVVQKLACACPRSESWKQQGVLDWTDNIHQYGLRDRHDHLVKRIDNFSPATDDAKRRTCLVSRGDPFSQYMIQIPVKLQPRYLQFVEMAETRLFRINSTSAASAADEARTLIVVHWRRKDQMTARCSSNHGSPVSDSSINCASSSLEFITYIRNVTSNAPINSTAIYVATNEENKEIVNDLSRAGLWTFEDLGFPSAVASPVDRFVIELALMARATTFLGWGFSAVNSLVERMRRQESIF